MLEPLGVGTRIRRFRLRQNMTQKALGQKVGFPEKSADVRIAQYESSLRVPKQDLTQKIAAELHVSPMAIDDPSVFNGINVIHALFMLEDEYGLEMTDVLGQPCLRIPQENLHPERATRADDLSNRMKDWLTQKQRLIKGEITRDEYDHWRYNYPDIALDGRELTLREHWSELAASTYPDTQSTDTAYAAQMQDARMEEMMQMFSEHLHMDLDELRLKFLGKKPNE